MNVIRMPPVLFLVSGMSQAVCTTLIMAEWLRNRDFSRLVQYESGARTVATDIICPMYQRLNGAESKPYTTLRETSDSLRICSRHGQ